MKWKGLPMRTVRRRITIEGAVQGVGFRPFVYRAALDHGIAGWVINGTGGVVISAEGTAEALDRFIRDVRENPPPHAVIHRFTVSDEIPDGAVTFEIRESDDHGTRSAFVLPDLATCPDCLRELFTPSDRRFGYPFINCTNCGGRYTLQTALPYDRPNTTMAAFPMCADCRREYTDPLDRRFHAQPTACPACGPHVALWDADGREIAARDQALQRAAEAVRGGAILALKGLGGFQLICDARDQAAVGRLRDRKRRPEKPFAVMFPSLEAVEAACELIPLERDLIRSAAAPIVLVRARETNGIAPAVAPENPYLGVFLPYTPIHHLLLHDLGFPIVATSGNRSGDPICTDEHEALEALGAIADLFLVHNRPIAHRADDSVVRVMAGEAVMIRRARGYAPLPIELPRTDHAPILAVGAQQKSTVALAVNGLAFVSPHIGDLESAGSQQAFEATIRDLTDLYAVTPSIIVHDAHPDYTSTAWAVEHAAASSRITVQHHAAHVWSVMAENTTNPPVLGIAWDGTGYGTDGTIWGGEFLHITAEGMRRAAHFAPFRLPGGEIAAREPRRCALGLLYSVYGDDIPPDLPPVRAFRDGERHLLLSALKKGINAPLTTSAGRLFDAFAALLDLRQVCSFEGQAAMALEYAAERSETDDQYPCNVMLVTTDQSHPTGMISLEGMVHGLVTDWRAGVPAAQIARTLHNTLISVMVKVTNQIGCPVVGLTGGCFQNRLLLEGAKKALEAAGVTVISHHQFPPNDGGVALGQIRAAQEQRTST